MYEIKDLRLERDVIGDAENHHLGITRSDRTPKLAFHTVKLLVRLLGGRIASVSGEARVTRGHGTEQIKLFRRPNGRKILIAWVPPGGDAVRIDIELRNAGGRVVEYRLDGTSGGFTGLEGSRLVGVALEPDEPRSF